MCQLYSRSGAGLFYVSCTVSQVLVCFICQLGAGLFYMSVVQSVRCWVVLCQLHSQFHCVLLCQSPNLLYVLSWLASRRSATESYKQMTQFDIALRWYFDMYCLYCADQLLVFKNDISYFLLYAMDVVEQLDTLCAVHITFF
jgi:hypothetical protein